MQEPAESRDLENMHWLPWRAPRAGFEPARGNPAVSRPPPYRARRPGQRFILKTKARISVSDPRHNIDARNRVAHTTDSMRVISGVIAPGLTDFGFPVARGRRQRRRRMLEPP